MTAFGSITSALTTKWEGIRFFCRLAEKGEEERHSHQAPIDPCPHLPEELDIVWNLREDAEHDDDDDRREDAFGKVEEEAEEEVRDEEDEGAGEERSHLSRRARRASEAGASDGAVWSEQNRVIKQYISPSHLTRTTRQSASYAGCSNVTRAEGDQLAVWA